MAKVLIPHGGKDTIQTPDNVAMSVLYYHLPRGRILEPCRGQGAFIRAFKQYQVEYGNIEWDWDEIEDGRDFFKRPDDRCFDWIITNPPYSQFRAFLKKSMQVATNVVFLTTINHLWLKARLRDIMEAQFGIRGIALCDTPETFPPSGFQVGCIYLQHEYYGCIDFNRMVY